MDVPAALAETVTPPKVSPAVFLIEPESTTSAAPADRVSARPHAAEAARIARCRLCCMVRSPEKFRGRSASAGRGCGGGRRWLRQRLDEGGEGLDLLGLEIVFEARHPRRALGNVLADQAFIAAQRRLRQRRPVLPRRGELRAHMADHAMLREQRL